MAKKNYNELIDETALYIYTHDRLSLADIKSVLVKLSVEINARDLEATTSRMNMVKRILEKCDEQGQV